MSDSPVRLIAAAKAERPGVVYHVSIEVLPGASELPDPGEALEVLSSLSRDVCSPFLES